MLNSAVTFFVRFFFNFFYTLPTVPEKRITYLMTPFKNYCQMSTENKSVDKMQPVRWLSPATTPQRPSIDRKLVVDFRGEENDADDNGNATKKGRLAA